MVIKVRFQLQPVLLPMIVALTVFLLFGTTDGFSKQTEKRSHPAEGTRWYAEQRGEKGVRRLWRRHDHRRGIDTLAETGRWRHVARRQRTNGKPSAIEHDFGTDWEGRNLLVGASDPEGGLLIAIGDDGNPTTIEHNGWGALSEGEGTVTIFKDGTFDYTPADAFTGDVSFSYRAVDEDHNVSEPKSARLTVIPEACGETQNGWQDCPEPQVTYQPPYPELGDYSLPDDCAAVHDDTAHTVVLKDGERLIGAWNRLLSKAGSGVGGVIEVPWDVDTVQCDNLFLNARKVAKTPALTLRGIPGPNGEQPRFYCRSMEFPSGTVPKQSLTGDFIHWGGAQDAVLVVENIHKDGYKAGISAGNQGRIVVRRSYFHHGRQDGISTKNSVGDASFNRDGLAAMEEYDMPRTLTLAFCGSEMALHGQGNTIHGFYGHRGLGGTVGFGADAHSKLGGGPAWQKHLFVDSICHSPNHSSCFKSIANEIVIRNSQFYQYLRTDPSYDADIGPDDWGRVGLMLVDISACARSEILDSEFHGWKPDNQTGAKTLIGIRARKRAVRGCDAPVMWTPYGDGVLDGEKPGPTASGPEPTKIDGPAHTEEWWQSLMGEIFFQHDIQGNLFTSEGPYADRQQAVEFYSTYPVYESGLGSPSCWLPTPMSWYERAHVYTSSNTFVNISSRNAYVQAKIGSNSKGQCPYPLDPISGEPITPPGPGPSLFGNFTNGGLDFFD
jgi:hypothetical protein